MSDVMKIILALSLSGTVLAGALALVRRLLKNKLPQALFYYLWLLVLLRLIVPVAVPLPEELRAHQMEAVAAPIQQQIHIDPDWSASVQQGINQLPPGAADDQWELVIRPGTVVSQPSTLEPAPELWHEQIWDFLCDHVTTLWLGGALVHFLWFALSYLRFCRKLKETCSPLWEHEQALLDGLQGEMAVTACRSPLAGTPMLVGLVRPRIILPDTEISTRQLEYILRHELTHLRRRDLIYKWFAVAATSFHWFNPFMPWLRKEISRCCELSCDEAVIGTLSEEQKQQYGETLLALAALHALPRAVPATTLCEEKQQLRERLLGIMRYKKATVLILLLSCLLAVLIAGCAAVLGPQKSVVELPRASDYALWINAEQQDVFVRNWKVEYHDGTHVASTHMAPADYEGDEYVFRGRDLPELRARVEAWAFAELPLDRENCVLYYRMEADALESDAAVAREVMRFPLDGGTPEKLALSELDMTTYCGYVTVTDLRDQEQWLLVLTKMPAMAENEKADQLHQWLENQYPDHTVLSSWSEGEISVLLAGITNPGAEGYQMLKAYVIKHGDFPTVLAEKSGEPNLSVGFSAHILTAEGLTILFGDTADSIFDYQNDARIQMNFTSVQVIQADQQSENYPITGDSPYLVVMEGEKKIESVLFLSNKGGFRYSDFYSRPLYPFAGKVAVLTKDAPLENAYVETVDERGNTVLMDMALTLQKGTLVYVEAHESNTCTVTVLAGEPPHPRGQLPESVLNTDPELLIQANQVILNNGPRWSGPNESLLAGTGVSGVANVKERRDDWLQVALPGGGEPFWVRRVDLRWEWPIAVAQSPETMSAADLKAYYMDFAMDWRVDFVPDFDWNSFSDTVSSQDFLMLTWYIHRDSLPEDGSMSADLVEMVMETQFGIEKIQHESLFKTWTWDAKKEVYLPVPQGVAGEGLFDTVAFNAAERWIDGSEQTVYTLTLREYRMPYIFERSDRPQVNEHRTWEEYAADADAYYRDNVVFLLKNKGEVLKNGEINVYNAMQQLILEGNTSGFTKGIEIQLEYYMTGNGPRFLYKSEREFDFTPGEVYENAQYGYRLTLPACWGDDYRLIEEGDSARIDTAWGGTLCSIFVREAAAYDEELIPVPYRVLGRDAQYVYLMYFASDVQYEPSNQQAYLSMEQDLLYVPFTLPPARVEPGVVTLNSTFPYAKAIVQTEYTPSLPQEPLQAGNDSDYDVVFYYKITSWGNWELEIAPQNAEEWVPLSAKQAGFAGRCTCGAHGEDWVIVKYRANFDSKTNGLFRLRMVDADTGAVGGLYENIPISGTDTLLVDLNEIMVSKMEYCAFCPAAWTGRETALPPGLPYASVSLGEARYFVVYSQVLPPPQSGNRHTFCFWNSLENTVTPLYTIEEYGGELWALSRKDDRVICNSGSRVLQFQISAETWGGIITWSKTELTKAGNPYISASPSQTRYAERQEEAVVIRDMATDRELGRLEGFRNINRMVWSGDESRLAVLSDHAFVTVWDLTDGTTVRYTDTPPEAWVNLQNVRLTDSGKQAFLQYLCEDEAAIVVWDVEANKKTDTITGQDLDLVDVRGDALLYFHSQKAPFQTKVNIYDGAAGTSHTVDSFRGYYTMGCFTGTNWDVLVNRYDIATYESRLIVVNAVRNSLYDKTAAWLEQEFHRVYDPYYDIQELVISNWQENGNEATFHYTMTWLNYNRDPDTVPYIQEAKTKSQSSYETLYQDYLALKTGNYSFKIVWESDTPTLYSDVAVKGEPEWEEISIEDYLLQ